MHWQTTISTEAELNHIIDELRGYFAMRGKVDIEFGIDERPKTDKQRSALHVWCEQLAETFNAAGLDMKRVLKAEVDIPWSKDSVKEFIYKPVLAAMTGKKSTEDMNTCEPGDVCNVITRHLQNNEATAGIEVPPWPSRFQEPTKRRHAA